MIFGRLFGKPGKQLVLSVRQQRITFNSLPDFEFALASRVEVPGAKVSALVKLSPDALRREAKNIRKVEKSFVDVLAKSLEEPAAVGRLLDAIDLQSFSNDHHWRDIVHSLREQPPEFDQYKQIALVRYMQYLTARQDVLKSIYSAKQRNHPVDPSVKEPVTPGESLAESALRETQIFDVVPLQDDNYTQLPRGETVEARMGPEGQLSILLSKHTFQLVSGKPFTFTDANGTASPVGNGKNIVGRYHGNHIVLDATYRDVSRKHLVIEIIDERRVRLTDLSSHGTFVPSSNLAAARN